MIRLNILKNGIFSADIWLFLIIELNPGTDIADKVYLGRIRQLVNRYFSYSKKGSGSSDISAHLL